MAAILLACTTANAARAVPNDAAPALLTLESSASSLDASAAAWAWLGGDGQASIEQAAQGAVAFRPVPPGTVHPMGPGNALWLKLTVQRPIASQHEWMLEFPMPVLDAVTLYQRDGGGKWKGRVAGDTVPVQAWPEPGRYPFFRLELPDDAPRELYVRIRHSTPLSLPIRLVTVGNHDNRMQKEYLGLGMTFGAMVLLVAACLARAYVLRDRAYAWYSGYALISMLAVAALTGVAAHVLWSGGGGWPDAAPGCLAILSGAISLLIVRRVAALASRTRALDTAIQVVAGMGFVLAVSYLFVERPLGVALLGVYMLGVAALSLSAATLAWRRGDAVGRWLMMGAVPLHFAVLAAIARAFGWMEASWITEYALVIANTLNLPMLLGAINCRSRERRSALLRQLAVSSQDPLTGLLKARAFHARVGQAQHRLQRSAENSAVAVIELANYQWIKSSQGSQAAEEALLRSVIKLRRLIRDVDTTGRLGESRFGLVLEGASSRGVVSQLASRLIASGLMKDDDSPDETELHFHVVAVLLTEFTGNDAELVPCLGGVLGRMSGRTRRPFRFMEPQDAQLADSSGGLEDAPEPVAGHAM